MSDMKQKSCCATLVVHGAACIQERIIWMTENLSVLAGIGELISLKLFLEVVPKCKSNFWDAPTFYWVV